MTINCTGIDCTAGEVTANNSDELICYLACANTPGSGTRIINLKHDMIYEINQRVDFGAGNFVIQSNNLQHNAAIKLVDNLSPVDDAFFIQSGSDYNYRFVGIDFIDERSNDEPTIFSFSIGGELEFTRCNFNILNDSGWLDIAAAKLLFSEVDISGGGRSHELDADDLVFFDSVTVSDVTFRSDASEGSLFVINSDNIRIQNTVIEAVDLSTGMTSDPTHIFDILIDDDGGRVDFINTVFKDITFNNISGSSPVVIGYPDPNDAALPEYTTFSGCIFENNMSAGGDPVPPLLTESSIDSIEYYSDNKYIAGDTVWTGILPDPVYVAQGQLIPSIFYFDTPLPAGPKAVIKFDISDLTYTAYSGDDVRRVTFNCVCSTGTFNLNADPHPFQWSLGDYDGNHDSSSQTKPFAGLLPEDPQGAGYVNYVVGDYSVSLTVTDIYGRSDTATVSFTITEEAPLSECEGVGGCNVGAHDIKDGEMTGAPVAFRSLEKREMETDLSVQTALGSMSFMRYYLESKLNDPYYMDLGHGWTHNHRYVLDVSKDNSTDGYEITLHAGATQVLFKQDATDNTIYNAGRGATSVLRKINETVNDPCGGSVQITLAYALTVSDGTIFAFDDNERLVETIQPDGNLLTYCYNSDGLEKVSDEYGNALVLSYGTYGAGRYITKAEYIQGGTAVLRTEYDYSAAVSPLTGYLLTTVTATLADGDTVTASQDNWTYQYHPSGTSVNRLQAVLYPSDIKSVADNRVASKWITHNAAFTEVTEELGVELDSMLQPDNAQMTARVKQVSGSAEYYPNSGDTSIKTTYNYFGGDRQIVMPDGASVREFKNEKLRPTVQPDANGNMTAMQWSDDAQRLTQITNAKGEKTLFDYEDYTVLGNGQAALSTTQQSTMTGTLRRLDMVTNPDDTTTTYEYADTVRPRIPTLVIQKAADGTTILRQELTQRSYVTVGGKEYLDIEVTLQVLPGHVLTAGEKDGSSLVADVNLLTRTTRTFYTPTGSGGTRSLSAGEFGVGLVYEVAVEDLADSGNNQTTQMSYDNQGRVVKTHQMSLYGSCEFNYTAYDVRGNVLATACSSQTPSLSLPITDTAITGLNPAQSTITVNQYDAINRLIQTTSNYGRAQEQPTYTVYDAMNRVVLTVQNYNDKNSAGVSYASPEAWTYDTPTKTWQDGSGRVIEHGTFNNENIISAVYYDDYGLVKATRDVAGLVNLNGYDVNGRLVRTVVNALHSSGVDYPDTDRDLASYPFTTTRADADLVRDQVYDVASNLIQSSVLNTLTDQRNSFTGYDELNRAYRTVSGANTNATVEFEKGDSSYNPSYDPREATYAISTAPDRDRVVEMIYDNRGRVIENRVYAGGGVWRVNRTVYDDLGRQYRNVRNYVEQSYVDSGANTVVVLPEDWQWGEGETAGVNTWHFITDTGKQDVDFGITQDQNIITETSYDDKDQVVETRDVKGRITYHGYDGLGRRVVSVQNYVAQSDSSGVVLPEEWKLRGSQLYDTDKVLTAALDTSQTRLNLADAPGGVAEVTIAVDMILSVGDTDATREEMLVTEIISATEVKVVRGYNGSPIIAHLANATVSVRATAWYYEDSTNTIYLVDHSAYNDQNIVSRTVYNDDTVDQTVDAEGNVTQYGYDNRNRQIIQIRNFIYDGNQPVTDWVWDGSGGYLDQAGGNAIDSGVNDDRNHITLTSYNNSDQVEERRDSRGNVTRYVYDGTGRQVRTIVNYQPQTDTPGADADPADWVWDTRNMVSAWYVSQTITDTKLVGHGTDNDQNQIRDTQFDVRGRVQQVRDNAGRVTYTVYDDLNRVRLTVRNYDPTLISGSGSNKAPEGWQWNDTFNPKRWETADGDAVPHGTQMDHNLVTETVYNRYGEVIETRDTYGTQTTFAYDHMGRRVQVTYALGTAAEQVDYTVFDKEGRGIRSVQNYTETSDPYAWVYTTIDNVTGWYPSVNSTASANVISHDSDDTNGLVNDQNLVMEYTYDGLGRRLKMVNPQRDTTMTTYDVTGLRLDTSDPETVVTAYRYDELDRMNLVVANRTDTSDLAEWVWDGQWQVN